MPVHNLIQFTDTNSGIQWTVTYDDSNGTVNAIPSSPTTDLVTTEADLGVSIGTVLYQACEGYTQVIIKADVEYPFGIQERQNNSVACGYTGPVGSITPVSNSINALNGKRIQTFKVGDYVPVGCGYHLQCYGHEISYTAQVGDTATNVATALRNLINATTEAQWNEFGLAPASGTNGFPPQASLAALSPSTLVIQLNSQNQFAGWVTGGQPTPLSFSFTVSLTNETVSGYHDGTATITTNDSMGLAYEYSLDGINYQTSNVFTALLPGSYIIYVAGISAVSSLIKTDNFTIAAGIIPATAIDFPWADKFCYFFKLIRNNVEYVVSEPIRWDSVNIVGKRDMDWHGWNYQYSDGVIELEFDCPAGKEVIKAEYDQNGNDGKVLFQYGFTYKGVNYLLFPGKFNFNSYKEYPQKVTCSVEREDFNSVFQSRFESKVSMAAVKTVGDLSIVPPAAQEFTLHSKEILRTFRCENNTVFSAPQEVMAGPIIYVLPDTSAAQLTEIEEGFTYAIGFTSDAVYDNSLYSWKVKYDGIYNFYIKYQIAIEITELFEVDLTVTFRTYWRKKNVNGFQQILLHETGPYSSPRLQPIIVVINVDKSHTGIPLTIDDEIYIWTEADFVSGSTLKTKSFKATQTFISMNVTALDIAPATTCKGWWLFDAIDHGIKVITDKKSLLKSNFLSLKNAQQAIDGQGALNITTNGKQVRQFDIANNPLQTSVKDLLTSAKAIWCLGMGFEASGSIEVVRVERANYFFQNREILVIEECYDYKKEVAKDVLYNEFEFGYEKYQDSGYNTLDEFNTKNEGLTPIQTNKLKLIQKSRLIASGYALEDSRRQQFSKTSTNSYQNDDETFLIAMRRISPATYAPEKNEAFDVVNNIISPATAYNLRLSPIRILVNWAIWLKNAFFYKVNTEKIKVTYVAQNGTMQTQFKTSEQSPVGDLNKSLWTEKQDIDLVNIPVEEKLWRPEWVYFKARLTPDKILLINEALRGRKQSNINYGYIVVKDHNGDYQAGWPYEINYNFATELAEFKMRMKWDSPVTPGAVCCDHLVVNGCYILINGNKLMING
jgi:hypothetical protein